MSIKELLSKVKEFDASFASQKDKVSVNSDLSDQNKANSDFPDCAGSVSAYTKLLQHYSEVKSWLETHECQAGTDNTLDVNDRPYDHELYSKKLKELETTICEILNTPFTVGLAEQVKEYGL